MSAFLALAYPDRVELLTDGAVYTDDGTLTDIRRKVWTADNLPIAFAGRGGMEAVEALASVFRMASNFSATVDGAIDMIAETLQRHATKETTNHLEMVICAMSESRGPTVLYFATADIYGTGLKPWVLLDMGGEVGGGSPIDVSDLDGRDGLVGIGAEIFERMRRVPGPNPAKPDLPDLYGVGGHVDLTVVRADGVTMERLHTWPEDVVGQPIDPFLKEAA